MPRPAIDFTLDTAEDADGERLINAIATGIPRSRWVVYVSGDQLPFHVAATASHRMGRSYGRWIYEWDDVHLIGCLPELLLFETPTGQRVDLPLVHHNSSPNRVGGSELILSLLSYGNSRAAQKG